MISVEFTGGIFAWQKYGGVTRYIVELVKQLQAMHEVDAFIRAPLYLKGYLFEERVGLKHVGVAFNKRFRGFVPFASLCETASSRLTPGRSDLLHNTYYNENRVRRFKGPCISTFYDMVDERFSRSTDFQQRKRRVYGLSDRCIAISESTKRDMVEYFNADPAKIDVVHLATSFALMDDCCKAPENYLLWVGERDSYKNFQTFAAAFAISQANKQGVRVICVGGPGFSANERENWASLGLEERQIEHVRPQDERLKELYAGAIGLVYVSRYEGFGIPPLEAMCCNCPVIASNTSSIPEVVGDAGLLVDPTSNESIAGAIDRVVFDNNLRRHLILKGRERTSDFSWARCAAGTLESYQKLLA